MEINAEIKVNSSKYTELNVVFCNRVKNTWGNFHGNTRGKACRNSHENTSELSSTFITLAQLFKKFYSFINVMNFFSHVDLNLTFFESNVRYRKCERMVKKEEVNCVKFLRSIKLRRLPYILRRIICIGMHNPKLTTQKDIQGVLTNVGTS